jgi:hypothetical protein
VDLGENGRLGSGRPPLEVRRADLAPLLEAKQTPHDQDGGSGQPREPPLGSRTAARQSCESGPAAATNDARRHKATEVRAIFEEEAARPDQAQAETQTVTGLTGAGHRSDRWGGWQHDRPRRSTSPLRKFINFIFGMCRSQHDIQVEQQRSRRANKQ